MVPKTGEPTGPTQTQRLTPCLGTLVAFVPCVGGTAGLSMEGEGKAAWGYSRAAASHVGCCMFCVVVFHAGPYFWLTDM
jgi:hypothetical protein